MKKNNIISNLFFSFLLQFTNMFFPLIISPYISEHLGIISIGKVNFSNSIVSWLLIFCVFGSDTYAVREIAKLRDNKKEMSAFFYEIMSIKTFLCLTVLFVYIPTIFIIPRFHKEIYLFLVQGIQIILSIFSIDWFFQGIENFKFITLRSIFMKFLSFFMIFLMIKNSNDYVIYAFISIVAASLANLLNINYIRKNIHFSSISLKRICIHLKKMSVFFLSSLVISIYSTFNQVFLGFLSNEISVALFARAKQFFSLCLTLTNTISTTLLPRVTNYYVINKSKYVEMLKLSYDVIIIISIPMMVGLFFIAKPMMVFLGGKDFIESTYILYVFAPLLIFIPLGTWNFNNRQLPMQLENIALKGQIYMAIINILLNSILIHFYQHMGAAVSYFITETFGCVYGFYKIRNNDNSIQLVTPTLFKVILSSSIMCIFLFFIPLNINSIISVIITILFGAVIYFIMLILLKEKRTKFLLKNLINKLRRNNQ